MPGPSGAVSAIRCIGMGDAMSEQTKPSRAVRWVGTHLQVDSDRAQLRKRKRPELLPKLLRERQRAAALIALVLENLAHRKGHRGLELLQGRPGAGGAPWSAVSAPIATRW